MQQSTVWGEGGRQIHNNIALNSVAGSKPSKADPAPKHNNKPQQHSLVIANEWMMQYTEQNNYQTSNNQPKRSGWDLQNLLYDLCLLVTVEIINILP
jgi:hypothetical protein